IFFLFIGPFSIQYAKANVNITNGNNFEQTTDLAFNSPFIGGLAFKRYYNSQSEVITSMGYGWSQNYDLKIFPNFGGSDFAIKILDASGRGYYFKIEDYSEGDTYHSTFSGNSTIIQDGGNNYIWTRANGTIYKFNDTGILLSITDKNGNIQNLTYNGNSLLETVTDLASGRVLTFYYNASDKIDYITGPVTPSVPDSIWVSYSYDGNNNLTGVQYADDGNGSPASGFTYIYNDTNDVNNLTRKKDLTGTILSSWTYNTSDQATGKVNNKGTGALFDYTNPDEVEVTDMYGIRSTYYLQEFAGSKKVTMRSNESGCTTCSNGV
ncbi:MAG: hypothetical protein GY699_15135, partial [Desulfobacteraceae bacterium]|nr:hypothetical protein [Desulfobacteraceae bacterium]